MPIPDDPIVGHKTYHDGHHEPLRQSDETAIMAASDAAKARRAEQMPDEQSAISAMFEAWLRLKELGWKEAQYCPKDGSWFDAIEPGSTGVHSTQYTGEWPKGYWWVAEYGDLWPSRPCLFKLKASSSAAVSPADGRSSLDVEQPVDPSAGDPEA